MKRFLCFICVNIVLSFHSFTQAQDSLSITFQPGSTIQLVKLPDGTPVSGLAEPLSGTINAKADSWSPANASWWDVTDLKLKSPSFLITFNSQACSHMRFQFGDWGLVTQAYWNPPCTTGQNEVVAHGPGFDSTGTTYLEGDFNGPYSSPTSISLGTLRSGATVRSWLVMPPDGWAEIKGSLLINPSPTITLLFTNDVHGLWEKQMDDGRTILQRIADETAAEKQQNPDGVLLSDAGDVGGVAANNMRNLPNYSDYLQKMRLVGYDAVAIGNHDCCGGNKSFGYDWKSPEILRDVVAQAQATGLHVISTNVNALSRQQCDPSSYTGCQCLPAPATLIVENQPWLRFERQVENFAYFLRNGIRVGIFGLTAPSNYGASYASPFSSLLAETQMRCSASTIVAEQRDNVDLLIGLMHTDFDGSIFFTHKTINQQVRTLPNPVTGCVQLIERANTAGTPYGAMGLPIDIAICGHDHPQERSRDILDRGDGKYSYAYEAGGGGFACNADSAFKDEPFCTCKDDPNENSCLLSAPSFTTALIPRPRLGKVKLALSNGIVSVVSREFVDLGPRYYATYEKHANQVLDGYNVIDLPAQDEKDSPIKLTRGQILRLSVSFRNLGTRKWFQTAVNPEQTQVRLHLLDERTQLPLNTNESIPFVPLLPATLEEESVAPGKIGTFVFNVTIPSTAKVGSPYSIVVGPFADYPGEVSEWMNWSIQWRIQVK